MRKKIGFQQKTQQNKEEDIFKIIRKENEKLYQRLKNIISNRREKTGEKCQTSGEYKCRIHHENAIPLSKSETFPPCSRKGGHNADWIFVRAI